MKLAPALTTLFTFLLAARPGVSAATPAESAPRWERPPGLQAAIKTFNAWKPPVPARQLLGNIHYVGTSGIAVYLITTPAGHILIDTGFEETVPHVMDGIRQLGLDPKEIKFLLSSHAHVDHVGGLALVQRLTGATVVATEADARIMASGGADDFSPFPKEIMKYPALRVDRVIREGERVTLGGTTLTAHLTPGHTQGATTWSMRAGVAGRTFDVVFLTSLSIVQGTRLIGNPDHPGIRDDFERSFRTLAKLPCDVYFTFHTSKSSLDALMGKLRQLQAGSGINPFTQPETGWAGQLVAAERAFREQLRAEESFGR